MYNLLEYSDNYSLTSGSMCNYHRDEVSDDGNENNAADSYRIINNKTTTSRSFEYKTKIIRSTSNNNSRLNVEVVVLLKYLSSFWRSLDFPNCKIGLDLSWSKYCINTKISITSDVPAIQTLIQLFQLEKQH